MKRKIVFSIVIICFIGCIRSGLRAQTPFMVKPGSTISGPYSLTAVNNTLFFLNFDGLWKSDGTAAGTVLISSKGGKNLINVNGTLFFSSNDGFTGNELWKSDGTSAGTVMVKDIYPGGFTYMDFFTNFNGTLYFVSQEYAGPTLWKSDGTASGTICITPNGPIQPKNLTVVNNYLFFSAKNKLWKTDGTAAGTVLVKDINAGNLGIYPEGFANINGILYFKADDATTGLEPWKSDGTSAGTGLIKDIIPGTTGSNPFDFTYLGGNIYFRAGTLVDKQIWKTDGTDAGTVVPVNMGNNASVQQLMEFNNKLLFGRNGAGTGLEPWMSDGTAAGTSILKDIYPGTQGSSPNIQHHAILNGILYFIASDDLHNKELWKTDGTNAGTVLVYDIYPGIDGSDIDNLTFVGNTLFFSANNGDGINGNTLWALNISAAALAAPSNLTASPALKVESAGKILLTWTDNANNENGFSIERSPNGTSNWTVIDSVAANVNTYKDSVGLASSTPYYYQVRAFNANGNSSYSNISSATTFASGINSLNVERMMIYPNPANEQISIQVPEFASYHNLKFELLDISGKIMRSNTIVTNLTNIKLDGVSSGMYFYQIKTDKCILKTGKISVQ